MNVNNTISNIKPCYKNRVFAHKICRSGKSAYLCNVFFIVLNLRLTKVGVRRDSFFLLLPDHRATRLLVSTAKSSTDIYTLHTDLIYPRPSGVSFAFGGCLPSYPAIHYTHKKAYKNKPFFAPDILLSIFIQRSNQPFSCRLSAPCIKHPIYPATEPGI